MKRMRRWPPPVGIEGPRATVCLLLAPHVDALRIALLASLSPRRKWTARRALRRESRDGRRT